jgi:hypothetical protein
MHNNTLFIVSFTIKEVPFTLLYPNILKTLLNIWPLTKTMTTWAQFFFIEVTMFYYQ